MSGNILINFCDQFCEIPMKGAFGSLKQYFTGDMYYFTLGGTLVSENSIFCDGDMVVVHGRMQGGKGGFGSMLRAIGAQIEKTTNHEACRDLSGRRMRDVNNEKQLKEWMEKKEEREKTREKKRKDRLQKMLAIPNAELDEQYYLHRDEIINDIDDALEQGMSKDITITNLLEKKVDVDESSTPHSEPSTSQSVSHSIKDSYKNTCTESVPCGSGSKRPASTKISHNNLTSKKKRVDMWLGVSEEDLSESDGDS